MDIIHVTDIYFWLLIPIYSVVITSRLHCLVTVVTWITYKNSQEQYSLQGFNNHSNFNKVHFVIIKSLNVLNIEKVIQFLQKSSIPTSKAILTSSILYYRKSLNLGRKSMSAALLPCLIEHQKWRPRISHK